MPAGSVRAGRRGQLDVHVHEHRAGQVTARVLVGAALPGEAPHLLRHVRLGVLSNKPDLHTQRIVGSLFPRTFAGVRGGRRGVGPRA